MKKIFSILIILHISTLLLCSQNLYAQIQYLKSSSDTIEFKPMLPVVIYSQQSADKDKQVSIKRQQLNIIQSNTLGATLSKIPGVQNSYFGPNVGAPVIRSLSGNRVKILNDGIGLHDLSGISPNINLTINQDNIQKIEVYKHSASALYGGKAIGGAVNIKMNAIADTISKKRLNIAAALEGSSNNGWTQNFSLWQNNGKRWAWNVGGMLHYNDLIKIPGQAKSYLAYDTAAVGFDPIMQSLSQVKVLSQQILNVTIFPYLNQFVLDHINDPSYGLGEYDKYTFKNTYYDSKTGKNLPNPKNDKYVPGQDPVKDRYKPVVRGIKDYVKNENGIIPNSKSITRTFNAGLSYIHGVFQIGAAYQLNYARNGIPAYADINMMPQMKTHNHTGTLRKGPPLYLPINVENFSQLLQLQSKLKLNSSVLNSVKLNAMSQLAKDKELLGDTMVNQFNTQIHTARVELEQKRWNFLSGLFGAEYNYKEMKGEGFQRYLPNNLSRELSFFTQQYISYKFMNANLAYRYDKANRQVLNDTTYQSGHGLAGGSLSKRIFDLHQLSAGIKINPVQQTYFIAQFSHSERAPEVNELYAGNNHFAIITEENGDDKLKKEIANTLEVGVGVTIKNLQAKASVYKTKFKNYIYLAHTGIYRGQGFLVKEWRAADTDVEGTEAEIAYKINLKKSGIWVLSAYYDLVKNRNVSKDSMRSFSDGDYMPNMPTSRIGFGISGDVHKFNLNISLDHYLQQKYLGKNINPEYRMKDYSLLSVRVAYRTEVKVHKIEYYISGNNLLNVAARPQHSLLKYLTPLPGINISAGVKVSL